MEEFMKLFGILGTRYPLSMNIRRVNQKWRIDVVGIGMGDVHGERCNMQVAYAEHSEWDKAFDNARKDLESWRNRYERDHT